jgi:hypothetical protein
MTIQALLRIRGVSSGPRILIFPFRIPDPQHHRARLAGLPAPQKGKNKTMMTIQAVFADPG